MTSAPVTSPAASSAHERYRRLWRQIRDLDSAKQLLEWDQETYMPAAGAEARARALATLAGIEHEKLTAPELAAVTEEVAAGADADGQWTAQARQARDS